jgi:multiple sugar transport system ATP-binding protein
VTLDIAGLGYRYPGAAAPAVDGLTLTVAPGQVLTVVGPSGSGKSTLLRLLAGLLAADTGEVRLDGRELTGLPPERRPVAMMFQGYALFPHLTVAGNIGFGLRVRRTPRAERVDRVARAAAALGLTPLLGRLPAELSGGERQRAALARALVRDPRVFCLDEPLSSLDPLLRADARRELDAVLRADGRCAVYVTHEQAEALSVGDRVAVLRAGRLEQVATPRELYARPATRFVAGFVGTPPMSVLTARGGRAGPLRPPGPVPDGFGLGVRAEDVVLGRGGTPLRVVGRDDVGHEVHVALAVDGERLLARTRPDTAPTTGSEVYAWVDPDRVHVFTGDGTVVRGPARP